MNRDIILARIHEALAAVLERDVSGLPESTRLFEELHLDSTSILELLMALEDFIGMEIDPESLNMSDFQTIGSLVDYVAANLGVAA
jgi:acyl carrier protein